MSNDSTFDADAFLSATFDVANSTARINIPEDEYTAVIDDVKLEGGTSQTGRPWMRLDIKWAIDSDKAREVTGIPQPSVRQGIMLDLAEHGGLDMGKGRNVGLGRLRQAVGLNEPGKPFSFMMLKGRVAKVRVSHRVYEGQVYDDIKGVAPL